MERIDAELREVEDIVCFIILEGESILYEYTKDDEGCKRGVLFIKNIVDELRDLKEAYFFYKDSSLVVERDGNRIFFARIKGEKNVPSAKVVIKKIIRQLS